MVYIHPTSTKDSVQLTDISGSQSLCTQMVIILYPVMAGLENQNNQKIKKSKQSKSLYSVISVKNPTL